MQLLSKRFGILSGFALMLLLLLANVVTTRRQLGAQLESQVWVIHTRDVLLELSQTESLLKDAEVGQRGFLYTGDAKYLAPYQSANHDLVSHLARLKGLIADNPQQKARVITLQRLINQKRSELSQTISLFQSGNPTSAKALVSSDVGLRTMDQIRNLIDVMEQEEISLASARSAAYEKSVHATIRSLYLTSIAAMCGLILLAYRILRSIELRQKHAKQLLDREEWFRVTLTSLGDAVIATDESGDVSYLNPLAEQLMGVKLEHVKGRPILDVFPIFNEQTRAPVENPVAKVMKEGRIVGLANHTVLQHTDGSFIPIEDSASPIRDHKDRLIGVVLVFRDATLERKIQQALRESEKLSMAARMAATVAHEINNPLEAVGNLIYLTKGTAGLPNAALEHLNIAEQELERVSHITKQTLGFYREKKTPEPVHLHTVVEYVLTLHANKLKTKQIAVAREFQTCPPVYGIEGEIKQVLSNLISNAVDAVSEQGTIWVRLSHFKDETETVRIEIEDNGPGILPTHIDRIFEPFFTTKKDVGTGLGLWVSKEIVARHGGTIHIQPKSEASGGAAFKIFLPCVIDDSETRSQAPN